MKFTSYERRIIICVMAIALVVIATFVGVNGLRTLVNTTKNQQEQIDTLKIEAEATPEPAFVRGISKYIPENEISLTREEEEIFAKVLVLCYGLDRPIYSNTDMYAIGAVVLNRVESEYFPDTVMEVLNQPGQFPAIDRISELDDLPYMDEHYRNARYVVDDLVHHQYRPLEQDVLFYREAVEGIDPYGGNYPLAFSTPNFWFYKLYK